MNEESIFVAALQKNAAERAAFLDGVCAADPQVRANVQSLLNAHEEAGGFLEPDSADQATEELPNISERPGTVIGRYKLLQQIGEGGFGVVFMAEQLEPVRRKVALKVIKPGKDTKEVIARFEAERQALALMDHPNIAKVFDAGATESGRPYFVMELVKGIPITDYCDKNQLAPRARLELFISVCQAVQHAHQKGIIHRDVKPNNTLVTLHDGKPVVKVIDFGVAKAIGQRLTERTLFTRFSEMIGTPLYMSPEQAEMSGLDVDTRTDIYSLGVLVYELLTGSTPFDKDRLGKAAYDEIRRIIREEDPPKPSTRVSTLGKTATAISEHRKTEPKKLSAILQGDLDWIVMKALEKDRTRRYETAKDFADDVNHYLTDQPVEARAPSTWYRLQKLVQRYRLATATTAVGVVVLVTTAVFSSWMAIGERNARKQAEAMRELAELEKQRAERESQNVQASLAVFGAALSSIGRNPGGAADHTMSEFLRALASNLEKERNTYVRMKLRPMLASGYVWAGQAREAREQYKIAIEELHKANAGRSIEAADILIQFAILCGITGQAVEHEQYAREAIDILKDCAGDEARRVTAWAHGQLVEALHEQRKPREALDASLVAIPLIRETWGATDLRMAYCIGRVAECQGDLGDPEKQLAGLREAAAICEGLADSRGRFGFSCKLGETLRSQRRLFEAADSFVTALRLSGDLGIQRNGLEPWAIRGLSDVYRDLRDWESLESLNREYLAFAEGQLGKTDQRFVESRCDLIESLRAQGLDKEAKALSSDTLSIVDRRRKQSTTVLPDMADRIRYAYLLGMTLSEKAALEATMRELELVENEAHKSADLRIRRQWHEVCSQLQQRLDRDDDAIQHARAALESVGEGDFGTQHRNQARLVQLLVNAGQLQDAESVLRKSLADKESKIGGDDIITNYARADLAEFLVQLKSYAEAEELLQQAQKYLLTDVRVPVLQRERVAGVLAKLYDAWGKPERASIWRAKLDNRPASEPNSPEEISASGK